MSFKILSASDRVVIGRDFVMQPFVRYVLPAGPASAFTRAMLERSMAYTGSSFNSYYRPYGGADLNGKRLAFYRHAAFGDQLMATAVAVYLTKIFPKAMIDVYCTPDVMEIWRGLPVRVFPAPMIFEAMKAYDWHLFYDQMLEENREEDQSCAIDDMFAFAGLHDVPDKAKRPQVKPGVHDQIETDALHFFDLVSPKRYLVYHLGAANRNRTYPLDQGRRFVEAFLDAYPNWEAVVVGVGNESENRDFISGEINPRIRWLVNRFAGFRSLIPVVQNAGLIVCPDSSVGHLAAAFPDVPVISLWGLFSPADRAKYYTNHHPLWPHGVCPFAPCHNHEFKLPEKSCRAATNAPKGEQKWCNVLRAISPEMILEKAKEILKPCKSN